MPILLVLLPRAFTMPTDEQLALWSAIRAQPADDTLRLVYADWLQENGDETRAEFIRLQCQIARLPDDRKTQRKVLPALEHRQRVLLTANRERWGEPLYRALFGHGPGPKLAAWAGAVAFRRGFISGMSFDLDGLHRVATAAADLEPLDDLRLSAWHSLNARKFAEVFASEAASLVSHLMVRGATDSVVRDLTAGERTRLTYLLLNSGAVSDDGAALLADWPRGESLSTLHLDRNRISDRGAEALAASPHLAGLAELNLEYNPIGPHAAQKLVNRFGGNVRFTEQPA